jgi:hypothetical protein
VLCRPPYDVVLELEPEDSEPEGGVPDEPDGGAAGRDPEPELEPELGPLLLLPMLGQLSVEPEDVLEEPELVLVLVPPAPVFPELEFEVVDGVVDELVAALAASAPPARRPDASAPTATTLRRRNGMGDVPFVIWGRPARDGAAERAPRICVPQHNAVGPWGEFGVELMTILRNRPLHTAVVSFAQSEVQSAPSTLPPRTANRQTVGALVSLVARQQ